LSHPVLSNNTTQTVPIARTSKAQPRVSIAFRDLQRQQPNLQRDMKALQAVMASYAMSPDASEEASQKSNVEEPSNQDSDNTDAHVFRRAPFTQDWGQQHVSTWSLVDITPTQKWLSLPLRLSIQSHIARKTSEKTELGQDFRNIMEQVSFKEQPSSHPTDSANHYDDAVYIDSSGYYAFHIECTISPVKKEHTLVKPFSILVRGVLVDSQSFLAVNPISLGKQGTVDNTLKSKKPPNLENKAAAQPSTQFGEPLFQMSHVVLLDEPGQSIGCSLYSEQYCVPGSAIMFQIRLGGQNTPNNIVLHHVRLSSRQIV
jgi:hypothetical protein